MERNYCLSNSQNINPVSISDTRPISIISPIAKTCEHILNSQIDRFIEKHKLLTPYQSGFRKKHSTATALIDITDTLRQTIDVKNVCIVVLPDFSSAFNLVNFDILLAKLKHQFHFSQDALNLTKSYLTDRKQRVVINGKKSEWLKLKSGTPQGTVLSPLLFVTLMI
jgi:retron-type reverse transcriptase